MAEVLVADAARGGSSNSSKWFAVLHQCRYVRTQWFMHGREPQAIQGQTSQIPEDLFLELPTPSVQTCVRCKHARLQDSLQRSENP